MVDFAYEVSSVTVSSAVALVKDLVVWRRDETLC